MSAPPSASTEASRSIPESFRRGIRLRGLGERPPVELDPALPRLLEFVFEPDRLPPRVERPHVAERIGPGHARRIEFLLAGADRFARRVDLEGVEPALLRDRDRLGVAVLAVNDDLAGAALFAAREPEILDRDPSFRAVDAEHVLLRHADARCRVGDHATRKRHRQPMPSRRRPSRRNARRRTTLHRVEERLPRRGAREKPRHRHRVAADIEDRAAGGVVGEEPALRLVGRC